MLDLTNNNGGDKMNQTNTEEMYHHGILGQKWGVRRYQNKDGSLTSAGRKRAKLSEKYDKFRKKKKAKSDEELKAKGKQRIKDMSDADLQKKIERLRKEKEVAQLQKDVASKGEKFASHVGKNIIVPAATEASKRLLTDVLMKIGNDKLQLKQQDSFDKLQKEVKTLELNKRKIETTRWLEKNKNEK